MAFITHLTAEGETWDLLAWRYYGNAYRYPPIVAANPQVPLTPVLPAGITLNIPVLATEPNTANRVNLPPWMR